MVDPKQIGQIIEGHYMKTLDKVGLLADDLKELGRQRFEACLTCHTRPHPQDQNINGPGLTPDNRCKQCYCDMTAKTLVINATCPIGRW